MEAECERKEGVCQRHRALEELRKQMSEETIGFQDYLTKLLSNLRTWSIAVVILLSVGLGSVALVVQQLTSGAEARAQKAVGEAEARTTIALQEMTTNEAMQNRALVAATTAFERRLSEDQAALASANMTYSLAAASIVVDLKLQDPSRIVAAHGQEVEDLQNLSLSLLGLTEQCQASAPLVGMRSERRQAVGAVCAAIVAQASGDEAHARRWYEIAIATDPAFPEPRLLLAQLYQLRLSFVAPEPSYPQHTMGEISQLLRAATDSPDAKGREEVAVARPLMLYCQGPDQWEAAVKASRELLDPGPQGGQLDPRAALYASDASWALALRRTSRHKRDQWRRDAIEFARTALELRPELVGAAHRYLWRATHVVPTKDDEEMVVDQFDEAELQRIRSYIGKAGESELVRNSPIALRALAEARYAVWKASGKADPSLKQDAIRAYTEAIRLATLAPRFDTKMTEIMERQRTKMEQGLL